jgi:hypothetical protein
VNARGGTHRTFPLPGPGEETLQFGLNKAAGPDQIQSDYSERAVVNLTTQSIRFSLNEAPARLAEPDQDDGSAAWALDGAVATITGVEMRALETVDQAAGSAIAMLQDGDRLSRLWRYVFVQRGT